MDGVFSIVCFDDFVSARARFEALAGAGCALPFQRAGWLDAWYGTHARQPGVRALPTIVIDRRTGRDVMALPLAIGFSGGMTRVAFADRGITDYNAPVLGPDAPHDVEGATAVLAALRAGLPTADRLDLVKMPTAIAGRPNPLALLPDVEASSLTGNVLTVPGPWDAWHWGLERTFRKELERSLRVFEKAPGAVFRRVGAAEAPAVLAALRVQQEARIAELGLPYVLDRPENVSFYNRLVAAGVANGSVVLTGLFAGEEVVAALLGITDGAHYAMVRLATAGAAWKACSPGRLVIERTMRMLHAEGTRVFDFTIGDYAYKRRLGVAPVPLVEWHGALSWKAVPALAAHRAKGAARANPAMLAAVRKLRVAMAGTMR